MQVTRGRGILPLSVCSFPRTVTFPLFAPYRTQAKLSWPKDQERMHEAPVLRQVFFFFFFSPSRCRGWRVARLLGVPYEPGPVPRIQVVTLIPVDARVVCWSVFIALILSRWWYLTRLFSLLSAGV